MNTISAKTYVVIAIVALILIAGLTYFLHVPKPGAGLPVANPLAQPGATAATTSDGYMSDTTARDIVTSFGTELQKVPLLAPDVASSMEEFYGPYVSPDLLKRWEQNPSSAPGKQTSSPWPDHIEIGDIEKTQSGYVVRGQLVYMTSDEVENGGNAGLQDVTVTLSNINGTLLITDYVAGQYGRGGSS